MEIVSSKNKIKKIGVANALVPLPDILDSYSVS